MLHKGLHISAPRIHCLLVREDGRIEGYSALSVERIAIAQAHPRLHALSPQAVHDPVEPFEVIYPLLLLAAGPSGLNAGIACAKFSVEVLDRIEVRIIPVQTFAADGPAGLHIKGGHTCIDLSEHHKSGVILDIEVIPYQGIWFLGSKYAQRQQKRESQKKSSHLITPFQFNPNE